MITWVVGRGGLLGRAIASQSGELFNGSFVPWADHLAAVSVLREDMQRFKEESADQPWSIVWAAGSATTASSALDTATERATFEAFLTALRTSPPRGRGAVFVTSSAGGVYAGSTGAPFHETTHTVSLSSYGHLKLAQEGLARDLLADVCPVVIGRVSNLYGPGQNLLKLQGLISRLALSAVTRQPINIFVPLDTIRDYIYVDDAATAVVRAVRDALAPHQQAFTSSIIASGQPATVGQLLRTMNQITKRRVPVALGSHASAASQAADLRVVPTTPLQRITPLPAGMKAVYLDILERVQQRQLTS